MADLDCFPFVIVGIVIGMILMSLPTNHAPNVSNITVVADMPASHPIYNCQGIDVDDDGSTKLGVIGRHPNGARICVANNGNHLGHWKDWSPN